MNNSERIHTIYRPEPERVRDFAEVERNLSAEELAMQAERCRNCGIPFCHGTGCPLDNVIPEMNAAAAAGDWRTAWEILRRTGNFPEFTGRICPALCESACTSGIAAEAVMIRQLEKAVVEHAFAAGWVTPRRPEHDRSQQVAVVGAGPAGLAAADELRACGFPVTVFEKATAPGGLLRYGIPDFKLEKTVIDRRIELMRQAGIVFECGVEVGRDIAPAYLTRRFDAMVIALGTPEARDLPVPGRELAGIHPALEFLTGQNRLLAGEYGTLPVSAAGKRVVVIGGGDTGSDCVGTALRQGALSVMQLELLPCPPETRSESTPWPMWPYLLRSSSSHYEGGMRRWNTATARFHGKHNRVTHLEVDRVDWEFSPTGRPLQFQTRPNSREDIPADLVLLAMGFTGVGDHPVARELDLTVERGRILAAPERGIFVAGDAIRGASLVVHAIADGRRTAQDIIMYFKKNK